MRYAHVMHLLKTRRDKAERIASTSKDWFRIRQAEGRVNGLDFAMRVLEQERKRSLLTTPSERRSGP